jgi:hypothetical protein
VFDRKRGQIGVRRLATKKEEEQVHCNYVVDILDSVTFGWRETVAGVGREVYDWQQLPINDPRVQFVNLFDIIDSAHWYYSIGGSDESASVNEAYIENPHDIFKWIRELFKGAA